MPSDLREYETWARTHAHAGRVDEARDVLRRAAALGPLVVSVSWGKDSVVLADLALDTLGPVPLLHLASPYELPGWEPVAAYFETRTTVHVLPHPRTLAEIIGWLREVGLGYERDDQESGKARKRDQGREWTRAHGYAVQGLGMRAEESKGRRACFRARGLLYPLADGPAVACPLGWWTARDVWARIAARRLPYPTLYDRETHGQTRETLRNTGWLTTMGAGEGRIAWLRQHYPEHYERLAVDFPRVRLLG